MYKSSDIASSKEDEVLIEMHNYVSSFGFWFDKRTSPPKREPGEKILAYGGYIFEAICDEDGDWCSIGGDDFTHWMPCFEPPPKQSCAVLTVQPEAVHERPVTLAEPAYLITERIVIERKYNPKYGDNRMCKCGHTYYRHFDSHDAMEDCGCKYCDCREFSEAI